jgi:hypothetical protein
MIRLGLGPAVFLIFLTLRLLEHITWSWLWVTAPLWIPISAALAVVALVPPIGWLYDAYVKRKNRRIRAARELERRRHGR